MTPPAPVVVVTGSTGGIGLAVVEAALSRGFRVVLNSRRAEKVAAAVDRLAGDADRVLGVPADLRDADQVAELVRRTEARFGRVDLWVNNAAGQFFAHAEDISPNGWRTVVDSTLTSAFLCCRAVHPVLRRQGTGCILNISSTAAYGPHPGAAHYAAAKAGLNSLTQTLAVEWAPHGIRVLGVALGAVLTDASRFHDPQVRAEMEARLPTGRIATAREVAEVVLTLGTVDSAYFTGETVRVDGGFRSVMPSPFRD